MKKTKLFHIDSSTWENHKSQIDISKNAMLVETNFSCLGSTKKATDVDVVDKDGEKTNENSVNTTKILFAKDAMLQIRAIRSQARNYIKTHTLPWGKSGERLLPAKMFNQFSERVEELRQSYESAVHSFIAKFPEIMDQNRDRLGKIFSANDYPDESSLLDFFQFNVTYLPVPIENDFRVDVIGDAVQKTIKSGISDMVTKKIGEANASLLERMLRKVHHLSTRLQSEDGHFKDSSVTAISEIVTLVNELNFTENQEITDLANDLAKISEVTPKEIRDDESKKADVLKKANDLANKIEGIM